MKKITKEKIRHYSTRYAKSKAGTTLVELVAVIAILAITSGSCVGAMFAMVDVAKRGQQVSESQRICALLGEQFLLYGNTASFAQSYTSAPSLTAYDPTTNPAGFMDANNGRGEYNEFFVSASTTKDCTIQFQRFDSTLSPYGMDNITTIDNIKKIDFTVDELALPDTSKGKKYVLEYTITTSYDYEISGGVVLNNTVSGADIVDIGGGPTGSFSIIADHSDPNYSASSGNMLRIRSTDRGKVNRT